jgi:hypothetical protein
MAFEINAAIEVLERTPSTLRCMLTGLSDNWTMTNEGEQTWSPFDVLGHLVHGERTDWMARLEKILEKEDKKFDPFDRFAQFHESKGKSIADLLNEFEHSRKQNIIKLKEKNIIDKHLQQKGIHPHFGEVTLEQLLSTWVAHDLGHIAQISRVMAKQLKDDVGPWQEYLRILR